MYLWQPLLRVTASGEIFPTAYAVALAERKPLPLTAPARQQDITHVMTIYAAASGGIEAKPIGKS